jgi:hypothetical protein
VDDTKVRKKQREARRFLGDAVPRQYALDVEEARRFKALGSWLKSRADGVKPTHSREVLRPKKSGLRMTDLLGAQ